MQNAIEKFKEKMNQTSLFWKKTVEITAQHGEIISVKSDGFSFQTDFDKKIENVQKK